MIVQYYCPDSIDEALKLLEQTTPPVYPLGGGSVLSQPGPERYAVVDLQRLGLNGIDKRGNLLHLGATVTLQALTDAIILPPALRKAAKRETSFNLRQTASLAGSIVSAKGSSPLATALLALDARLVWLPGDKEAGLGEYLAQRKMWNQGKLITEVRLPADAALRYADVARSPEDVPLVCAAVARWADGRVRVALGSPGDAPLLAVDGPDASEAEESAYSAYSQYISSTGAEDNYLQETSRVLVHRLLAE